MTKRIATAWMAMAAAKRVSMAGVPEDRGPNRPGFGLTDNAYPDPVDPANSSVQINLPSAPPDGSPIYLASRKGPEDPAGGVREKIHSLRIRLAAVRLDREAGVYHEPRAGGPSGR